MAKHLSVEKLRRFCVEALEKAGLCSDDAATVADVLVMTESRDAIPALARSVARRFDLDFVAIALPRAMWSGIFLPLGFLCWNCA